jgi:hypothetical protein
MVDELARKSWLYLAFTIFFLCFYLMFTAHHIITYLILKCIMWFAYVIILALRR